MIMRLKNSAMMMIPGIVSIILGDCTLGAKRLDFLGCVIVCGQERRQIALIPLRKELFIHQIGKTFKFKVYAQVVGM